MNQTNTTVTYPIAIDPALGLDPAEVAAAWNANAETAPHGTAQPTTLESKGFDLAEVGLEIVTALSTGLIGAYIYDLIKGVFAERSQPPSYVVQELEQEDGTKIILVVKE